MAEPGDRLIATAKVLFGAGGLGVLGVFVMWLIYRSDYVGYFLSDLFYALVGLIPLGIVFYCVGLHQFRESKRKEDKGRS